MSDLRVCWATDYEGIGNSYGYSVHNAEARNAIQTAGVELDNDAPVAMHVAPAHLFKPIEGKRNVLFTNWEMEDFPPNYVEHLAMADVIVVTASFIVPVVKRYLPDKPVFLCPLGVDTEVFGAVKRRKDANRPFRFLWVGAPNARKGWEVVAEAFKPFFGDKRFELYLKTTVTDTLVEIGNVIFDSRKLDKAELASLYRTAHCFVFPSFGEGFGLTMAEAMATGLPVIYTPWSAMLDLAPADARVGFPLRYRMVPVQVEPGGGLVNIADEARPGSVATLLAQADTGDLADVMANVWRNYEGAARVGMRGAARIRDRFMWAQTGARLARVIEEVNRSWRQAHNSAA